jgi:hypothetical protein
MSVPDADSAKAVAFYMSSYRKMLKEKIRQLERWMEQADRRMEGVAAEGAVQRYREKMQVQQALLDSATPESEDFKEYYSKQLEVIERQQSSNSKRIESCLKEQEDNKKKLDAYYSQERENRRSDNITKYQIRRETERYFSIHETLPSYIRENLRTMPYNKGYIFRGVWYFGNRPLGKHDDPNVTIMIERRSSPHNTLWIHEYKTGEYHKIFEKKGKGPQTLISEEGPTAYGRRFVEEQQKTLSTLLN